MAEADKSVQSSSKGKGGGYSTVTDILGFFARNCGWTPDKTLSLTMAQLKLMFFAVDKVIFDENKFWKLTMCQDKKAFAKIEKSKYKDPPEIAKRKMKARINDAKRGNGPDAEKTLARMIAGGAQNVLISGEKNG